MFGLPVITAYGSVPVPGEVVGADPFDDTSDATYARGSAGPGFHHITSAIDPTTVDADVAFVFRASAELLTSGSMRFVANLYPPGWASGDPGDPSLNFTAGPSGVYVAVPVADGVPQDIPVSIVDWVTLEPATPAQIVDYFAAGGTLLIQPSGALGGTGSVTVHRVFIAGLGPILIQQTTHRDDHLAGGAYQTWPAPTSRQLSNTTFGGYL